jgi:hypothetical protein
MSYLDLLTDDIMINILDARCDDIEKQISKLENTQDKWYDLHYKYQIGWSDYYEYSDPEGE